MKLSPVSLMFLVVALLFAVGCTPVVSASTVASEPISVSVDATPAPEVVDEVVAVVPASEYSLPTTTEGDTTSFNKGDYVCRVSGAGPETGIIKGTYKSVIIGIGWSEYAESSNYEKCASPEH